uniref:ATP-citrate synthase n=1 Tax=Tigriopus kingsejongensis TaxID=1133412 RepID=A0A343U6Y3_9MAXI|nr:ATP citrate lyase [Tigriopus kingsejongensis]
MSARAISEATGKRILNQHLPHELGAAQCRFASIQEDTDWDALVGENPWLMNEKLVAKPDQLIKRRGKLGLIKVKADFSEAQQWIQERMNKDQQIGKASGKLRNFIIEPFVAHEQSEEAYVCIYSSRSSDTILFTHEGGVDIGDVDAKALKMEISVDDEMKLDEDEVMATLLTAVKDESTKKRLAKFIVGLYSAYVDLFFTYLEVNPLVVTPDKIYILDLAAKLDATADFICRGKWGKVDYPPPFGRDAFPEEAYIADIDAKTGASLKLTILNASGRIWTMVAGGGASVIYSDTVCALGGSEELANYGEYSGAPSEQQTYDYARTLLSLMTKEKHPEGKVLIVGGGIANFTNVAATFKGIVKALEEFQVKLKEFDIKIFVRRAGPNYQEGLRVMREIGKSLDIPLYVFGPETHMTSIVGMALGKRAIPVTTHSGDTTTANFLLPSSPGDAKSPMPTKKAFDLAPKAEVTAADGSKVASSLFGKGTKAIIWGLQTRAVQGMMDFDFVCQRAQPSAACMVYPMVGGDSKQNFYWGHKEILVPVYKNMSDAMKKHPDADVMVNFASLRSAYDSTLEAMEYPQIRTIAIIAEGIPENMTRKLIKAADAKKVNIIGPATVGGIKPGCFKIGNTGGMMDNILHSKLYRPGSVAYVSRSGGMSNELNNIISHQTDGVFEGIAIGGDRYPVSTFMDHLLRYQAEDEVKMLVLLGEVGGTEEYKVCEAIGNGTISKPIVAWCIGTCADMFSTDVQFGHAGASAGGEAETASAKNKALTEAGARVPASFDELGEVIREVYSDLVQKEVIVPRAEVPPPPVPMDYAWARELGLIRKPASFMTSICDERGQELIYAGMPITEVFRQNMGIGGVLSLLWFQRRLPPYACKFLEMCLMITADHGPAVSGAHNTIVCARAGKDLVSSLVSGLLTIGDRFGGALDGAAKQFTGAYDANMIPMEFVNSMRKKGQLIMGIGHRVKSINNPDMRVTLVKEFVQTQFPQTPLLSYALEVEKITTSKKPNLILNVDGCIAVSFVDLLRHSGCFTKDEADEFVKTGSLNGLFVLGRSIGFIGHYLDQKRLKQGLYRHPWDDISYVLPEINQ